MKKPTYRKNRKKEKKVLSDYEVQRQARRVYESEFEDRFKKWSFWRDECARKTEATVGMIEGCLCLLAIIYGIFLGFTILLLIITVSIGLLILYLCYKDNKIFLHYKKQLKDKYVEDKMKDLTK